MTSACACTTIYYIYNVHALLVLYFCSQSVKDRVSCPPVFGKRVQRYGLFLNWQNNSTIFFKKNEKKDKMGQKEGRFEEKKEKNCFP